MAAKHDAKKARANHWVMQQNLAKQKGGRPGYKFNEKKLPRPPTKAAPAPVSDPSAPRAEEPTKDASVETASANANASDERAASSR